MKPARTKRLEKALRLVVEARNEISEWSINTPMIDALLMAEYELLKDVNEALKMDKATTGQTKGGATRITFREVANA